MAHSYEYEEEEYFGDQFPLFDETLAGALGNTVQMSINNALERALGPLSEGIRVEILRSKEVQSRMVTSTQCRRFYVGFGLLFD
ncbi:hypothetical protein NDU88_007092 [Pleurodeles waltl]|uniref:Uncharacterized protein n=1 Tax=Pleurodeles waltl TaxID=8319 RepID=A0AAV7NS29_PLEWA|nr:hypothetical protein NDU88_007092 [Pleurodeles waltl]